LEGFLHHVLDLRFLRVFRLTRLLKLTRGNDATKTLVKVISREWPIISASAFIMILLVIMTASLGFLFEHEAQPDKFENIPQTIYWAVITLASIGYGDLLTGHRDGAVHDGGDGVRRNRYFRNPCRYFGVCLQRRAG
jgi:hypothetical protein